MTSLPSPTKEGGTPSEPGNPQPSDGLQAGLKSRHLSRMAFSLGRRGDAPKAFARTNARGVPLAAILSSVLFGFVAVFFNYQWPDTVFAFLLNSSGAVALFVWLVICFTQLRMRGIILREAPEKLVVRMWLFPYLTWATIAMISFVLVYMLTDDTAREQVLLSLLVAAVVVAIALVKDARQRQEKAEINS